MESDLVDERTLHPDESMSLVESYFQNLKGFRLIKKSEHAGYWWLEFLSSEIKICFEGDTGGHFSVIINIENEEFRLWQFNKAVNNATRSTKKNIQFQLDVLNLFLESKD